VSVGRASLLSNSAPGEKPHRALSFLIIIITIIINIKISITIISPLSF